jgi:hypothetical protein
LFGGDLVRMTATTRRVRHHPRVAERRVRCALLTVPGSLYDAELTLACPGLELVALTPSAVGLTGRQTAVGKGRGAFDPLENVNPFALPEDDAADVVLIESHSYRLAAARHPERIGDAMRNLERRASLLVGLDADQFALGFPPSTLERLGVVIEFDGVYRDRDLYNYFVGCRYPGANWTEMLRPSPARYRAGDLDKVRLSVPCFMRDLPVIRRAARARLSRATGPNGTSMSKTQRIGRDLGEALLVRAFGLASCRGRPLEVNCLVAPTHPQRIDACGCSRASRWPWPHRVWRAHLSPRRGSHDRSGAGLPGPWPRGDDVPVR